MLRAASIESIEPGKFLAGIDPDYIAEGDCSLLASACIYGSLIMAIFCSRLVQIPSFQITIDMMWASLTARSRGYCQATSQVHPF